MALVTDIDTDFDSSLPTYVHSIGVTGFSHRYVASTINAADGADVLTWNDLVGTAHATVALSDAGATPPNMGISAGEKYLSFDGNLDGMRSSNFGVAHKTLIEVVRVIQAPGLSTNLWYAGGVVTSRNSTNAATLLLSGGAPSVSSPANSMLSNVWEIVMTVADGNNSFIRAGSAKSPLMATGVATGIATYLGLGREGVSRMKADVAEAIAFERILSDAELDTVMNALIARYGPTLGVTA